MHSDTGTHTNLYSTISFGYCTKTHEKKKRGRKEIIIICLLYEKGPGGWGGVDSADTDTD